MQKSVLNKHGKFGVKILWRYTDMAIFVLRCFILTHPVEVGNMLKVALHNSVSNSHLLSTSDVFYHCMFFGGFLCERTFLS